MSVELLGSKHVVSDVYPVRNKRVLVLVDPQNIVGDTVDDASTLTTIAWLLRKGAAVVVASSFGTLTGITLNLSRKEREVALDAFTREGGMGFTHFMSALSPAMKVQVLRAVPGLTTLPSELSQVPNTGKTTLFASLSNAQKIAALKRYFPKMEFFPATTSTFVDALRGRFPQHTIKYARDCVRAPLHQLLPGEVLVLENLRFYKNETSQSVEERAAMAEVLAAGIDVYVNDSFATSHLSLASTVELPRRLQHGAAGYSMDRELAFYSRFFLRSARPLVVAVAGDYSTGKLRLLRSLVGKVDRLLVAGSLALPLLAAKGLSCGLGYHDKGEAHDGSNGNGGGAANASSSPSAALRTQRQGQQQRRRRQYTAATDGKRGGGGSSSAHDSGLDDNDDLDDRNGGAAAGTLAAASRNDYQHHPHGSSSGGGGGSGGRRHHHRHLRRRGNDDGNDNDDGCNEGADSDDDDDDNHYHQPRRHHHHNMNDNTAADDDDDAEDDDKDGDDAGDKASDGSSAATVARCSELAHEILRLCRKHDVELVLPIDHLVVDDPDAAQLAARHVETAAVPSHVYAVDCGPHTIQLFARYLRDCRTVFWTGTLGWVSKGFTTGTNAFAALLGRTNVISIVGGRYTARVVHEMGVAPRLLHVSSGGMACLGVLLGHALPGVVALSDAIAPATDDPQSVSLNELLRRTPLFLGCTAQQLRSIARKLTRRVYARGDYVVFSGDAHTRLCVVAAGGLAAYLGKEYGAGPARYVPPGQTVGMYEFLVHATALETVRAAYDGTVTYHLSCSALHELLDAHPDLALQLLQNVTEPLRALAANEHRAQRSVATVVWRGGCRTRVPQPDAVPPASGKWEDIVQDLIATVALQTLTMRYAPLTPSTRATMTTATTAATVTTATTAHALQSASAVVWRYEGLPFALAASVLRNVVYHALVSRTRRPFVAAAAAAVAAVPLRVLSYGHAVATLRRGVTFKLLLDEALRSAAVGVAPLAAYAMCVYAQMRLERLRQRRVGHVTRLLLLVLARLLLSVVMFPVTYQRNFWRTSPTRSHLGDTLALRSFAAKQVLSVLLRDVVHHGLKAVHAV